MDNFQASTTPSVNASPSIAQGRTWILVFLLALLTALVFARCFGSELVFDSVLVIKDDSRLSGFTADNLRRIFTEDYWWPTLSSDLYRPLTTLSFFVEKVIFGYQANPAPYQLTNLCLHIAVVSLGFFVLRRLGLGLLGAWVGSIWFAVHPYATEVVPNIVGRSDLFAMGSILGCLWLYLKALSSDSGFSYKQLAAWAAVLMFGCLSKESAISGVAIVAWHGMTLSRSRWLKADKPRPLDTRCLVIAALVVTVAAASILTPKLIFKERMGEKIEIAGDNPLVAQSFVESRVNAAAILGDNLVNTIAPYRVSADYSYNQISLFTWPVTDLSGWMRLVEATVTALFVLVVVFWLRHRDPALAFFFGAALLSLAPTANIFVQIGTVCADRLVYPAIWCMAGAGGLVLERALRKLKDLPRRAVLAVLSLCIITIACYTHFRCTDWRTKRQFWESVIATSPASYKANLGYGAMLVAGQNYEDAKHGVRCLQSSLDILRTARWHDGLNSSVFSNQTVGGSWLNFARLAKTHGTPEEVRTALTEAEKYLGAALHRLDQHNASRVSKRSDGTTDYSGVARVDVISISLAEVMRAQGRPTEAAKLLESHLETNKLSAAYLEALGFASIEAGLPERGQSCLFQALLLDDKNRELSRIIHTWLLSGEIAPQKRALASESDALQVELAPPLNIDSPAVIEKLNAAAKEISASLDAEKRKLEKARLQRTLRMMLRNDPADPKSAANLVPDSRS